MSSTELPLGERLRLGWLGMRGATDALTAYASPARRSLLRDLRRALVREELEIHYQPMVEMESGRPRGMEALVRWDHPERGFLWPPDFLPQVELSDVMGDVDEHVLVVALRHRRALADQGIEVTVAVNMSGACLDRSFPRAVERCLREAGVEPPDLSLELSERVVMANPDLAAEVASALSRMGVRLSLDDFGTGHSSLARLVDLPFDHIKIDKSFVLGADEVGLRIVKAITDLSHDLGRSVVVEGVETRASWERLAALRCDLAQGHWVSPPLPADEVGEVLERLGTGPSLDRLPPLSTSG